MANILELIEREYAITRENNRKKADFYLSKARADRDFANNEKRLKSLNFEIAKAEQFDLDKDKAIRLKNEKQAIINEQEDILKSLKISAALLTVKYTCPTCKDTGFVNGKPCRCFKEKWKRLTFESLGIDPIPAITFKNDTVKKNEKLEKVYCALKKYVEKFPLTNTHNFLFTGKTGCGKTFLASAVAGELAKKGFNCIFLTATRLNQLFLKMHTSNYVDRTDYLEILTNCDFLVIDDLGTENIFKNVTIEYLLALISERLAKSKHTIITTNLNSDEIMERYNERFFSRITEKRSSAIINFDGTNFRT